jgi:hypothetical protein
MSDRKRGIGDLWPSALAAAGKIGTAATGGVLVVAGLAAWCVLPILVGIACLAGGGLWAIATWQD